jgi:hypothetical protein
VPPAASHRILCFSQRPSPNLFLIANCSLEGTFALSRPCFGGFGVSFDAAHEVFLASKKTFFVLKTVFFVLKTVFFVLKTVFFVLKTVFFVPKTAFFVPKTAFFVPKTIFFVPKTVFFVLKKTLFVPSPLPPKQSKANEKLAMKVASR